MKRRNSSPELSRWWRALVILTVVFLLVGCQATPAPENTPQPTEEHHDAGEDAHSDEASHSGDSRQFVPNNGATVRIVSPASGDVFSPDDAVPVIIETTNFKIGEEGNHWHIYLDGSPIMVMGGETFVLKDLAPGSHEIEVYLSLGTHEDLEEGDKVTITVEEQDGSKQK